MVGGALGSQSPEPENLNGSYTTAKFHFSDFFFYGKLSALMKSFESARAKGRSGEDTEGAGQFGQSVAMWLAGGRSRLENRQAPQPTKYT